MFVNEDKELEPLLAELENATDEEKQIVDKLLEFEKKKQDQINKVYEEIEKMKNNIKD